MRIVTRESWNSIARSAVALCLAAGVLAAAPARAAEIEPRAYLNIPIGTNFVIAGYVYSEGGLSTDPASPLQEAKLNISTGTVAYARTLNLWGKSGKIDVIVPYSDLSGTATLKGEPVERQVTGFNDPRFRLAVNLYGAPAMSKQEFAGYRQDLIVGASLQVTAPLGQYDPDRLVNIVLAVALIASLVIGVGGAIGVEVANPTLRESREFKMLYDLPVLACIPIMQDDRYKRKIAVRRTAAVGGLLSIVGAYVVFLVMHGEKVISILQSIWFPFGGGN